MKINIFDFVINEYENSFNSNLLVNKESENLLIDELKTMKENALKRNNGLYNKLDWFTLREELRHLQTIIMDNTIKHSNYIDLKVGRELSQIERNTIIKQLKYDMDNIFKLTKKLEKLKKEENKIYETFKEII